MPSKRARILREVLDYINNDDWDQREGFLVFGKEAFEDWLDDPLHGGGTAEDDKLRALVTKVKSNKGTRAIAQKLTVGELPPDSTTYDLLNWLNGLDPKHKQGIIDGLAEQETKRQRGIGPNDADAVDAALTAEFLSLLDDTTERIAAFDEVGIGNTNRKVARYFLEAHRCHLLGLRVACAVLCRALLEAALVERIDPGYKLKPLPGHDSIGLGDSHISNMIRAASGWYLMDDRPEAADRIREAGNWAIHSYSRFEKTYSHRLGEIVDDTRKILIDLYGEADRK
jgi:hypothetical protein